MRRWHNAHTSAQSARKSTRTPVITEKKLLPLLLSRKCIWQMEIHSPAAGGSGSMQIHNLLPHSRFPRVDGGRGELLAYKRVGRLRRSVSRVQHEGQDHLIKVKPVSLIWHVIRELPGRRRRLRIFPPSPGLVWGKKELCVCCCWHDCEV